MPLILQSSRTDPDEGRQDGNILLVGTMSCYMAMQNHKAPNALSSA